MCAYGTPESGDSTPSGVVMTERTRMREMNGELWRLSILRRTVRLSRGVVPMWWCVLVVRSVSLVFCVLVVRSVSLLWCRRCRIIFMRCILRIIFMWLVLCWVLRVLCLSVWARWELVVAVLVRVRLGWLGSAIAVRWRLLRRLLRPWLRRVLVCRLILISLLIVRVLMVRSIRLIWVRCRRILRMRVGLCSLLAILLLPMVLPFRRVVVISLRLILMVWL